MDNEKLVQNKASITLSVTRPSIVLISFPMNSFINSLIQFYTFVYAMYLILWYSISGKKLDAIYFRTHLSGKKFDSICILSDFVGYTPPFLN